MFQDLNKNHYIVYFPEEDLMKLVRHDGNPEFSFYNHKDFVELFVPELKDLLVNLSTDKVYIVDWSNKTIKEAENIKKEDVDQYIRSYKDKTLPSFSSLRSKK